MLILNESKPEKSLYVIGALLLEEIKKQPIIFHPAELFEICSSVLQVSFPQFLLTLDWLYLIGLLDINDKGGIQRCF